MKNPIDFSRSVLCLLCCSAALACSAKADIPEVVITQTEVMFDGVPVIPGIETPSYITTSFDHPEGFEMPDAINPELYPLSVTITGREDMVDLSFIEELSLSLAARDPGGPEQREVAVYRRGESHNVGPQVTLDAASDANIVDYWDNSAFYQLTVSGEMPEEAWGVDVEVRLSGSLSVSTN